MLKRALFILGVTALSQGGRNSPSDQNASSPAVNNDVNTTANQARDAVYAAQLRAANPSITGTINGTARFMIQGDEMTVEVNATGLPPGVHMQHVHADQPCPPPSADTNGDGVIDVIEGTPFIGCILLPLNVGLNPLNMSPDSFPVADSNGTLTFTESGSVSTIIDELSGPAVIDPDTGMTKLGEAAFDLASFSVEIHGVAPDTSLPPTAQTLPGMPPQMTLPIACGEIVRVE
jgi:hypothetical protein